MSKVKKVVSDCIHQREKRKEMKRSSYGKEIETGSKNDICIHPPHKSTNLNPDLKDRTR